MVTKSGSIRSPWIEMIDLNATQAAIRVGLHTEPVD